MLFEKIIIAFIRGVIDNAFANKKCSYFNVRHLDGSRNCPKIQFLTDVLINYFGTLFTMLGNIFGICFYNDKSILNTFNCLLE